MHYFRRRLLGSFGDDVRRLQRFPLLVPVILSCKWIDFPYATLALRLMDGSAMPVIRQCLCMNIINVDIDASASGP